MARELARRVRASITGILRFVGRHEGALNTLLGFAAVTIAVISLYLSTQAYKAAERANRINEEGLQLSRSTIESKKTITLKAEIVGDPPILHLTPVSQDFVLSDSLVFVPCAGEACWHLSTSSTPGIHSLSDVVTVIQEGVKRRDEQRYVSPEGDIYEQWLPEAFPIVIRVDYVYEGEAIELHLLYIIRYRDPSSMSLNRHEDEPKSTDHAVKLQSAYFAGQIVESDDAVQVLRKEYRNWRRFLDASPEEVLDSLKSLPLMSPSVSPGRSTPP
jgi:hypothetical protein